MTIIMWLIRLLHATGHKSLIHPPCAHIHHVLVHDEVNRSVWLTSNQSIVAVVPFIHTKGSGVIRVCYCDQCGQLIDNTLAETWSTENKNNYNSSLTCVPVVAHVNIGTLATGLCNKLPALKGGVVTSWNVWTVLSRNVWSFCARICPETISINPCFALNRVSIHK